MTLPSETPPLPRGARADAESADAIVLVKNVSFLRATYQVRLLAFKAAHFKKRLVLRVPASCRFAQDLEALALGLPGVIQREDLTAG